MAQSSGVSETRASSAVTFPRSTWPESESVVDVADQRRRLRRPGRIDMARHDLRRADPRPGLAAPFDGSAQVVSTCFLPGGAGSQSASDSPAPAHAIEQVDWIRVRGSASPLARKIELRWTTHWEALAPNGE